MITQKPFSKELEQEIREKGHFVNDKWLVPMSIFKKLGKGSSENTAMSRFFIQGYEISPE